jgi:hypothetical protein
VVSVRWIVLLESKSCIDKPENLDANSATYENG